MKIISDGFILKIIEVKEFEDYFNLITRNKNRLSDYFPKTLKAVSDLKHAKIHLTNLIHQHKNKEIYPFGIYVNEILVGWISLKNVDWKIKKGELGYYIDTSFEGKGITSLAVQEITNFAFQTVVLDKVFLRTAPANIASQRIAIKNGFQKEGILRKEFKLQNGELIDTIYFGKLNPIKHR